MKLKCTDSGLNLELQMLTTHTHRYCGVFFMHCFSISVKKIHINKLNWDRRYVPVMCDINKLVAMQADQGSIQLLS